MALLSALFKRRPPLDEASVEWLFQTYAWALQNFSRTYFFQHARLVLPDNAHFPGRARSADEMAHLVFAQVVRYAGMAHWRWHLQEQSACMTEAPRGPFDALIQLPPEKASKVEMPPLLVQYAADYIRHPEALIAGFAHTLAQYLAATAKTPPPGGMANWPQATEVVAIFMGFGLMMANTAFVFPRGGCQSCAGEVQRDNALAQWDCTYALALFAELKGIEYVQVRPWLKKSLRSYYKRCLADIRERHAWRMSLLGQEAGG